MLESQSPFGELSFRGCGRNTKFDTLWRGSLILFLLGVEQDYATGLLV